MITPLNPHQPAEYRPLLRMLAGMLHTDRRLLRRFDESDLVQDALVKAFDKRDQFHGNTEGELVKWLQEILHNTFRDKVREAYSQKRNLDLEASLDAIIAGSSQRLDRLLADNRKGPAEQAEQRELLLRQAQAINSLPDDQRQVVELRDLQGLSVKEIAERLGRTEKAVAGLLLRGRERLRRALTEDQ
jgi:RNA polymerase sigma-70 factor (ECF subfamily)